MLKNPFNIHKLTEQLVSPWVLSMKVKSTLNYHNVRKNGKNMPLPGTGPYMPLPGTGPYMPLPGTGPYEMPLPGTGPY
jgi:hypothetical protein